MKQPSTADFEALAQAPVQAANKKQAILSHLNTYGLPVAIHDLSLFQQSGIMIKDTFANYLAATDFYSTGSFVKLAQGTPLDFQYDIEEGVKQELEKYKDRTSFDLGSFVHEAILEPNLWATVVCEPQASRASHEGLDTLIEFWGNKIGPGRLASLDTGAKTDTKKMWIDQAKEISGLRCVSFKDAVIVAKIYERWMAYQNGYWANILDSAQREVSCYVDGFNDLPVRVRPDGLLFSEQIGVNAIVSVKTTSAASVEQYKRQYMAYGYDIKEAAYQRIVSHVTGREFSTTIMIVLSTCEPFSVGVFILSDLQMEASYSRFTQAMEMGKYCISKNEYPGWEMYAGPEDKGLIDLDIQY